jgi:hypothetical protein
MAQLNVEIDDALIKKVKYACLEDGINLKKWVSAALELALDFDELAMARCRELGWVLGDGKSTLVLVPPSGTPPEIIEEPPPGPASKPKRVPKA